MSTGGESAEGEKESEKNQEGERRRVREKDTTKERAKEIWEIPKKSFQHPDRRGGGHKEGESSPHPGCSRVS